MPNPRSGPVGCRSSTLTAIPRSVMHRAELNRPGRVDLQHSHHSLQGGGKPSHGFCGLGVEGGVPVCQAPGAEDSICLAAFRPAGDDARPPQGMQRAGHAVAQLRVPRLYSRSSHVLVASGSSSSYSRSRASEIRLQRPTTIEPRRLAAPPTIAPSSAENRLRVASLTARRHAPRTPAIKCRERLGLHHIWLTRRNRPPGGRVPPPPRPPDYVENPATHRPGSPAHPGRSPDAGDRMSRLAPGAITAPTVGSQWPAGRAFTPHR
jgi:hypothetical protein